MDNLESNTLDTSRPNDFGTVSDLLREAILSDSIIERTRTALPYWMERVLHHCPTLDGQLIWLAYYHGIRYHFSEYMNREGGDVDKAAKVAGSPEAATAIGEEIDSELQMLL